MCLITKKKKITILTKDKIVYKKCNIKYTVHVTSNNNSHFKLTANAAYHQMEYIRSVIQPHVELTPLPFNHGVQAFDEKAWHEIVKIPIDSRMVISEGYHAFESEARSGMSYCLNNILREGYRELVEFTIPKGSQYVSDDFGLCVSSQIILTDKRFVK